MNINKSTFIVTVILTLVIGVLAGSLIFPSKDHQDEHLNAELETTWTCSMHPQVRQNEPGACPICGMDLVPVSSLEEEQIGVISMSPTAMQLASVRTVIVGETDPVKELRLNGRVEEDERQVSSQSSHVPGRIERLTVNYTGEYVKRGQVIAYLYSPELVTAQQELLEARKISDRQPGLYNAAREKLRNWKLSEGVIDRIAETGEAVDVFPITADISGYVLEKNVNVGDYIKQGESLYEIADLSRVWVVFDLYESDLPWVNEGDTIRFTVQSVPGRTFSGDITFIDPVIDPKTRVARARVEVQNRNNSLKPQMFVRGIVQAELENRTDAMVVPKSAVLWTGERSVVYVKKSSATNVNFELREVTLGPSLGENYVIEAGLERGEEIAVSGTFSIDAAAQLAGKPSMMNPDAGTSGIGSIEVSDEARQALVPLYQAYLDWKNALIGDETELANEKYELFQTLLESIDPEVFSGAAENVWKTHSKSLKAIIMEYGSLLDLEEQRTSFQHISRQMIEMTRKLRPLPGTLYIQYCPMADSNRGAYWLSERAEVRNPYYGESMLTCGEVTDSIQ